MRLVLVGQFPGAIDAVVYKGRIQITSQEGTVHFTIQVDSINLADAYMRSLVEDIGPQEAEAQLWLSNDQKLVCPLRIYVAKASKLEAFDVKVNLAEKKVELESAKLSNLVSGFWFAFKPNTKKGGKEWEESKS